MANVIS